MAIVVADGAISCLVSSWMISHFGRKPVSGGRPARESRVAIKVAFSMGVFVHDVIIVDSFRVLVVFRARNTVAVISEYR